MGDVCETEREGDMKFIFTLIEISDIYATPGVNTFDEHRDTLKPA